MRDHALYFFLICSDLAFPVATGFLFFPDLASEAREAQVARLFLFSCREALFSPDIPDLFSFCFLLLFPFLTCLRIAIRRAVYLTSARLTTVLSLFSLFSLFSLVF
jgi:hypothetical protein